MKICVKHYEKDVICGVALYGRFYSAKYLVQRGVFRGEHADRLAHAWQCLWSWGGEDSRARVSLALAELTNVPSSATISASLRGHALSAGAVPTNSIEASVSLARDRFESGRHRNKPKDSIGRDNGPEKGSWTHTRRQPVKVYTPEEIERFKKERGWK